MEQIGAKIVGIVLNNYNLKGTSSHYASRYGKYHKNSALPNSKYAASYRSKYAASYQNSTEQSQANK